jgi:hypothetical protein
MEKAKFEDKELIIDLLVNSFDANQSVNYIVKQDKKRLRRIRYLMEYSVEVCSLFGDVWVSENRNACALVLYPHTKTTTLKSVWLDLKLIVRSIGIENIGSALKREALIKQKQPKKEMSYLWFIGVNPVNQHSGIGSGLLNEVLLDAAKKNLPVYLETSTIRNIPWYRRFEFEIYDELKLTYVLYFLRRDPAK